MSELRWILLTFGIVLLASIYLWGRGRSGPRTGGPASVRLQPAVALRASEDESEVPVLPALEHAQCVADAEGAGAAHAAARAGHELQRGFGARPQSEPHGFARARQEPTLHEVAATPEVPLRTEPSSLPPTQSSLEQAPAVRRLERRKILSLRLSVLPEHIEGARLLECLLAQGLEHGKYEIFHHLHADGTAIFSVASMVEPGTFDLETMSQALYPGVTLFAQLPAPVPGMHALNELVACARSLQQALGGVLQDDRGVTLTVHRIERMRQEVREFERPATHGGRTAKAAPPTHF